MPVARPESSTTRPLYLVTAALLSFLTKFRKELLRGEGEIRLHHLAALLARSLRLADTAAPQKEQQGGGQEAHHRVVAVHFLLPRARAPSALLDESAVAARSRGCRATKQRITSSP